MQASLLFLASVSQTLCGDGQLPNFERYCTLSKQTKITQLQFQGKIYPAITTLHQSQTQKGQNLQNPTLLFNIRISLFFSTRFAACCCLLCSIYCCQCMSIVLGKDHSKHKTKRYWLLNCKNLSTLKQATQFQINQLSNKYCRIMKLIEHSTNVSPEYIHVNPRSIKCQKGSSLLKWIFWSFKMDIGWLYSHSTQ